MGGLPAVVASPPVGRRRRPSGEAPPLPREVHRSTRWYVIALLAAVLLSILMVSTAVFSAVTRVDLAIVSGVEHLRADWLTSVLRRVDGLSSPWTVRVIGLAVVIVLAVYRRFRYLGVFVATLLVAVGGGALVAVAIGRMRPAGVPILTGWSGYAYPSEPVLALAIAFAGVVYTLIPAGVWRDRSKRLAAAVLVLFAFTRVYLAVDHPTDVLVAVVVGWGLAVVAYRMLMPEEAFPVSYRRGTRAHLDVGGRRGEAIALALDHQLNLEVDSIEPFGLGGSAGSTPLRITARRGDERVTLFAKLYALNHLRSDRWYKFVRTIVYGRLEDEKPFSTVRRLTEYEDHMLRLTRDAGLPTPAPYGFAEITPEREYLIVMEFFDHSSEIEAPIDVATIDDGLSIVRRLWDAGIAHRDIKPSNLLIRDGNVLLIDVAFAAVRPTPWRQAVDLANMMLTLALASTPELVYERALRVFAPDDIAEAFAASRSITIPTQLRARMRADGRDLLGTFRRLAPERAPVSIQAWSWRRVALTTGVALLTLLGIGLVVGYVRSAGVVAIDTATSAPRCDEDRHLALVAQSVASAAYVPCVTELRPGWTADTFEAQSGRTDFTLVSDRDEDHPVQVDFSPSCDVSHASPTTPRADGVRTYLEVTSISPRYAATLSDVFPGGCVTYRFDFERGPHIALVDDFENEVGLRSRQELRRALQSTYDVQLDP